MAQEAYDFARFAAKGNEVQSEPQRGLASSLRSVRGGKRNQAGAKKVFGGVERVVWVIAFLVIAFTLLQSEAQLTEYTQQIQSETQVLAAKQSEYSYLETTLYASVNIEQVEKAAKQLGLVKVDESQITYIRIEDEAVLTTAQSTVAQWKENAVLMWETMLGYFNP